MSGDSASQAHSSLSSRSQAAMRLADLPVEVLWTFEDYKADSDVNILPSNTSGPPMDKAIQHVDGTMITTSE